MATSDRGLYVEGFSAKNVCKNIIIGLDNTSLRNRVYVRGGSYLSDEVEINMVADGEQVVFVLPEKPHDVKVYEDSVEKTVGIKNIDDAVDFDYLLNFQEKYIETSVAPVADTVITVTFKYDIPVLVALSNETSISDYGVFEYAIFDNSINTVETARARANAELDTYSEPLISISFITEETGFRAGQSIGLVNTNLGIDDNLVIDSVTENSLGSGYFEYKITANTSTKRGIVKFLVDMIEANKNALKISTDEKVDELNAIDGISFTLTFGSVTSASKSDEYEYDDAVSIWGSAEWS